MDFSVLNWYAGNSLPSLWTLSMAYPHRVERERMVTSGLSFPYLLWMVGEFCRWFLTLRIHSGAWEYAEGTHAYALLYIRLHFPMENARLLYNNALFRMAPRIRDWEHIQSVHLLVWNPPNQYYRGKPGTTYIFNWNHPNSKLNLIMSISPGPSADWFRPFPWSPWWILPGRNHQRKLGLHSSPSYSFYSNPGRLHLLHFWEVCLQNLHPGIQFCIPSEFGRAGDALTLDFTMRAPIREPLLLGSPPTSIHFLDVPEGRVHLRIYRERGELRLGCWFVQGWDGMPD